VYAPVGAAMGTTEACTKGFARCACGWDEDLSLLLTRSSKKHPTEAAPIPIAAKSKTLITIARLNISWI